MTFAMADGLMATLSATSGFRQGRALLELLLSNVLCIVSLVTVTGVVRAEPAANEIGEKRRTIATKIRDLSENAATHGATNENDDQLARLQALDVLYVQIQSRKDERQRLQDEQKTLEREVDSLTKYGLDEPKPYSFLLYEAFQDRLAVEKERAKALEAEGKSAAKLLAAAHEELDQARDQSGDRGSDASQPAQSPGDLTIARERAQVELREAEVDNNKLRQAVCEARQKELQCKIKIVKEDVRFSLADRDEQLGELSGAEARLRGQRRQVERELQRIEERIAASSRQPDTTKQQPERRDEKADIDQPERQAVDACQSQIVLLDERLEWLNRLRRVSRQRYDVANENPSTARLQQWLDEEAEFREDLSDAIRSLENRRDTARTEQATTTLAVEHKQDPQPADEEPQDKERRDLRDARLGELAETCAATLLDAEATQRVLERFHDELTARLPEENAWGTVGRTMSQLFGYPVAGEDDHTVTLGTLLVLLGLVLAGILLAWAFSRAVQDLVLRRLGLHRGKVDAVNSIFFYALCFAFGYTAFRVLNVPLAAFAFLGGAAAIAVGFGSQDIMNNFMSGMILLAEQPIRVGDVVMIDDVTGVVMHIGMRSTRLLTESNHEVTVPNKSLLEEQVTNFTLSDNMVQVSVVITLDRETKIAEAKERMLQAVFSHPVVVKSMQPLVLVKEIDNYWLTFEIRFWLQYQNFQQCAIVQSHIMEVIGDIYRPLTDEEKEAKKAAQGKLAERLDSATTDSGAETRAGVVSAEDSFDEDTGTGQDLATADTGDLGPAAKMMFRKLGRKIANR